MAFAHFASIASEAAWAVAEAVGQQVAPAMACSADQALFIAEAFDGYHARQGHAHKLQSMYYLVGAGTSISAQRQGAQGLSEKTGNLLMMQP